MAANGYMVEIVHSRPAEMPVGDRKPGRLDYVGRGAKARAQPQNRSGVLGNVGLEKSDVHGCGGFGSADDNG
jgi:hypothetical protein